MKGEKIKGERMCGVCLLSLGKAVKKNIFENVGWNDKKCIFAPDFRNETRRGG